MELKEAERWSPLMALSKADQYIEDIHIPSMKINLEEREELDFSNLMNADSKQLELFLSVYGGYKAHLERELADVEAKKEAYSSAIFILADERESAGKKKLTRDEVRGAAFGRYDELKNLRKRVIEQEAIYTRVEGLLKAYSSGFQTISRVVALRTHGGSNA